MSSILLGIVSIGLAASYAILIYNLWKYFKEQMKAEMRRLTVIYTAFVLSYNFRWFYELSLGRQFWAKQITSLPKRWFII